MHVALPLRAALLLALAACAGAPSPDVDTGRAETAPRAVLHGADCLDPAFARSWHEVDSHEVLVDAGRRKYRMLTSGTCLFGSGVSLNFVGDPVSGRVCGTRGDRIVTRDGSCWIDSIELIDAQTWNAIRNRPHGEAEATTTTDDL
jgi:hypothetical protein